MTSFEIAVAITVVLLVAVAFVLAVLISMCPGFSGDLRGLILCALGYY